MRARAPRLARIARVALVVSAAIAAAGLPGCLSQWGDPDDAPDGRFVNYRWGSSARSCTNGQCAYGDNADAFSIELRCRVAPTLSWDANSWVHGTITAIVLDDAGAEAARHVVAGNGRGEVPAQGKAGTWTLKGTTGDANGNAEVRLTCA